MPATEETDSYEGSLRHQCSWESGSSIPMWDSSDPTRAPAPLPLHPGRSSPVSNRITSPNVAAAHEALVNKARESNYVTNPLPPRSPEKGFEKSLIRSAQRRMTNFQTENIRPSPLSPTRDRSSGFELRTPEASPTRQGSEPNLKDLLGDAPNLRPSRPASRAITGEPSPQSATMKALMARPGSSREEKKDEDVRSQNSTPKASTPGSASVPNGVPGLPQSYEGLASQIIGLTSICTNLQHEMSQLTRRSKDNASDLMSLRDATNTRDEDIRDTLRNLVTGLSTVKEAAESQAKPVSNDTRARSASPRPDHLSEPGLSPKRATLPRIPSLQTFSASLDGRSRPNLNIDGAPALALLEKIHDEMATKMDIATLHETIEDIPVSSPEKGETEKPKAPSRSGTIRGDPNVTKKLEEIIAMLKNGSANTENVSKKLDELTSAAKDGGQSQALVPAGQYRSISDNSSHGQQQNKSDSAFSVFHGAQDRLAQANQTQDSSSNLVRNQASKVSEAVVNEEMMKILRRVNNSVFESGGLTAEIKMLLRDMRGEVLGMGRNITSKLEQLEVARAAKSEESQREADTDNETEADTEEQVDREEVVEIVQESFAKLKSHFDRIHQEYRRSSGSSLASRATVDVDQIESVVNNQLKQLPPVVQSAIQERFEDIQKLIADTIKENWESFKPELSIEMEGIQRDEIVETIKECLQKSRSGDDGDERAAISGATYDEVVEAVQHAMENFKLPPAPSSEMPFDKEEILVEMKEEMEATLNKCLENFEFPSPAGGQKSELDFDHEEFLDAVRDEVREGLAHQGKTETMLNIAEDDLVNAVRIGLQEMPLGQINTEVLRRCQGLIDEMKTEFKQYSSANGRDTEQVLDAMSDGQAKLIENFKTGMDSLRTDIESYVDRSQDVTGKDEIIETVRGAVESMRTDMEDLIAKMPQNTPSLNNTAEILEGMEKEFEHLRITLTNVVRADTSSPGGREELLDAIREGFDDLKRTLPKSLPAASQESSNGSYDVKHMAEVLAGVMLDSNKDMSKAEMATMIREAIEEAGLNSDSRGAEKSGAVSDEILSTFSEAFDSLKVDYERVSKRTQDSNTITYDVLETLKSGISSVRSDIDRLSEVQKERRGSTSQNRDGAVVVADPETAAKALEKNDIEKLEVMIGQLKTQVDSIPGAPSKETKKEATTEASSDTTGLRSELMKIQDLVLDLQVSMETLAAKNSSPAENAATKEDTDALETLLLNTKAFLEDMKMPEGAVASESIEKLHEMMQSTRDVVEDFAARNDADLATKQDIAAVEMLAKDLQTGMEELRLKPADSQLSKDDIGGIELLCDDMKQRLDGLANEGEALSTRNDIETLSMVVKDFQEKFEVEVAEIAKGLGSRKTEHGEMTDKIEEIRAYMETVKDELKAQLDSRKEELENVILSVNTIGEKLSGEGEKDAAPTRELHDTVTREFERAHGDREEMKIGLEQHRDELMQKHEEHRDAMVAELGSKIDEKFSELISRYEDTMLAADGKATTLEETSRSQAAAVEEAKAIAEELKISIDALAPTVTKACDEMVVDSKAAFSQITSVGDRIDEGVGMLSSENKGEHSETRAELAKAQVTLASMQAHAEEYNPRILSAIADVLERVNQQHEESRRSAEEIKSSVHELPSSLPALPAPSSETERELPMPEKYDDASVQAKLDQLIELSAEAGKASAHSDVLDQIRTQVATTAAGLDAFVKNQQAFNDRQEMAAIEASESKARELEETNLILEKRVAQKEAVEADIVRLMDEKVNLTENVEELMQQEKEVTNLKMRLQADLRGLETALQIRREEMFAMEKRASDLHNHILNSVIDGSRAALKSTRPKSTFKEMNLKRVPSDASNSTVTTTKSVNPQVAASTTNSALSQGVSMALKKRGATPRSGASTPNGGRRILSLSTIGANKAAADKALVLNNPVLASTSAVKSATNGLKRSHSVKSNFPTRKSSWAGTKQLSLYGNTVPEEDKENSIYEDDEEATSVVDSVRDSVSRMTDRRSSYAGTYDDTASHVTGSQVGDDDDDDDDDDDMRSFVSSSLANIGYKDSEIGEYEESEVAGRASSVVDRKSGVYMPSDSGIGTDLPTAALTAGSEYSTDD